MRKVHGGLDRPRSESGGRLRAPITPVAVEPASAEAVTTPTSAPAPVKYMHPSNRNLTWNGEGEQPEWMAVYFARGGSWTALENAATRLAPRKR